MMGTASGKGSIGRSPTGFLKKGLVHNPIGKANSLILTDHGLAAAEAALYDLFRKT